MSERERWVVYPLLFLALGAALRDKLFDRTTTRSIVCQELTVVDEQPIGSQPVRVLAKIGRAQSADAGGPNGFLFVNGQVEVVDEAAVGQQVVTVPVAKIGRDPQARGGTRSGLLVVSGQVVAKRINADQYLYQNLPFAPAMQAIIPWSPTDLMRALRAPNLTRQRRSSETQANPAPADKVETSSPPAKPADAENNEQPARPDASDDPATESPLADPPENR
jgi:hypothetical protein